jgi:beta-glucosidase-like glycosyl hydrolase/CubicO group peptidase (beta-lactamase class C family)
MAALALAVAAPLVGETPGDISESGGAGRAKDGSRLSDISGEPSEEARGPESPWSRATLARLPLPEKIGQMIGVRASGLFRAPASPEARRLRDLVGRLKVGTVVVFESEVDSLPGILNGLQGLADVPLLVAADLERGMAFRIRRGVVPLPYAMAVGATRSSEAARFTGEVTAREGRALGIHWAFAPVVDVNNNPDNPVINIRSYGEDPALVARLSRAFIEGARAGGLLTTAKHFPGHGDTATDTHLKVATVEAARERLNAVELLPFRSAVEAGVDWVMMGHIVVPALDASRTPATLSSPIVQVLRQDLGFRGLIVTDALDMAGDLPESGVAGRAKDGSRLSGTSGEKPGDAAGGRQAWTGESAVRAVLAGADVILLPPQPEVAVQAILRAVRAGRIREERIDASVQRILETKERLGLDHERRVSVRAISRSVDRPEDVAGALEVARSSITVVRNEGGVLPLHGEDPIRLLHLVLSSDRRNPAIVGILEEELRSRRVAVSTVSLGPDLSPAIARELVTRSRGFTHVLASCFVRVSGAKGTADMSQAHARLLRELAASEKPLVVVSFGSPYLLRQFPEAPVYVAAYGSAESSQRAAIAALFGEFAVGGKLPVTLPGLYAYGHGLDLPRREVTLRTAAPAEVGFTPGGLQAVDALVERAVAARAFPGAVLALGKDGALAHLHAFGRLDYGHDAPAVLPDTIYDLASLTKIIVTTAVAMILVDEGRLDLAQGVSSFVPGFHGGAKDRVTVEQLLTHSSGLDWWGPLYKDTVGHEAYLEKIQAMDLVYEPGTRSLYSDLGLFLLGEVLERVAGERLDVFARRRVLEPLGMTDTTYRPGPALLPRIAPTENDPWRGRVLRGEVHDENAFALGGVAPHAGLFGTAPDLARFAQMILNGGVLESQRIVSRATIERFTRRCGVPGSSRALGWDTPVSGTAPRSSTPGEPGYSSAGTLFSERAFGHTGFTGTSLWIDPERQLFVILLTNRVHPTRQNDAIRQVRADVADAVVRALAASPFSGGR